MLDSLYIAATGMNAEQAQIDVISNNLSNLNTPAYKKSKTTFDDLVYMNPTHAVSSLDAANGHAQIGLGSHVSNIYKVFEPGDLKESTSNLDWAIRGNGFFEVSLENGDHAYTRNGSFKVSDTGYLQTSDGYGLSNNIQIPPDASDIIVDEDGAVKAKIDNQLVEVGQIELTNFNNLSELRPLGNNLYMPTDKTGEAFYSKPGENGNGIIKQGYLETSNVDIIEELVDLMIAQRSFGANSQIIQASDEIMKITNNLRR